MFTSTLKYSAAFLLSFSLLVVISCTKSQNSSIEGQIIVNTTVIETMAEEQQDQWPCDTTIFYVCLYESGELVECLEEEVTDEEPVDDVSDTTSYYFGELPPGDYAVAFYCEKPTTTTMPESEVSTEGDLISWYHINMNKGIMIKEPEEAEIITVRSGENKSVKAVNISNYVIKK